MKRRNVIKGLALLPVAGNILTQKSVLATPVAETVSSVIASPLTEALIILITCFRVQ